MNILDQSNPYTRATMRRARGDGQVTREEWAGAVKEQVQADVVARVGAQNDLRHQSYSADGSLDKREQQAIARDLAGIQALLARFRQV